MLHTIRTPMPIKHTTRKPHTRLRSQQHTRPLRTRTKLRHTTTSKLQHLQTTNQRHHSRTQRPTHNISLHRRQNSTPTTRITKLHLQLTPQNHSLSPKMLPLKTTTIHTTSRRKPHLSRRLNNRLKSNKPSHTHRQTNNQQSQLTLQHPNQRRKSPTIILPSRNLHQKTSNQAKPTQKLTQIHRSRTTRLSQTLKETQSQLYNRQ